MSEIRRRLDEQVKAGRLSEQCAHCGCSAERHENTPTRHKCWVCNDFCLYRPAWVIRPQPQNLK